MVSIINNMVMVSFSSNVFSDSTLDLFSYHRYIPLSLYPIHGTTSAHFMASVRPSVRSHLMKFAPFMLTSSEAEIFLNKRYNKSAREPALYLLLPICLPGIFSFFNLSLSNSNPSFFSPPPTPPRAAQVSRPVSNITWTNCPVPTNRVDYATIKGPFQGEYDRRATLHSLGDMFFPLLMISTRVMQVPNMAIDTITSHFPNFTKYFQFADGRFKTTHPHLIFYNEPSLKTHSKISSFYFCRCISRLIAECNEFKDIANALPDHHEYKTDFFNSNQLIKTFKFSWNDGNDQAVHPTSTDHAFFSYIPVHLFKSLFGLDDEDLPNEDGIKQVILN